jgi:hypothetical protein
LWVIEPCGLVVVSSIIQPRTIAAGTVTVTGVVVGAVVVAGTVTVAGAFDCCPDPPATGPEELGAVELGAVEPGAVEPGALVARLVGAAALPLFPHDAMNRPLAATATIVAPKEHRPIRCVCTDTQSAWA